MTGGTSRRWPLIPAGTELVEIVKQTPGRRFVGLVRVPDGQIQILKLYAPTEGAAWARHLATARLLSGSGLTARPSAWGRSDSGYWVLESELEGTVPSDAIVDAGLIAAMPEGLGVLLAQFHGTIALRRRRFGGRGVHRRRTLAAHVSARLGAAIDAGAQFHHGDRAVTRLIEAVAQQRARFIAPFEAVDRLGLVPVVVHGDYGSTNVLFQREQGGWRPAAVFDLEDAGPGDPAEDFKWPALDSLRQRHPFALSDMLAAYQARRRLDDGARERIRGHAIVLALEASSWSDANDEWRDDMTSALGRLLSGDDPLGLP